MVGETFSILHPPSPISQVLLEARTPERLNGGQKAGPREEMKALS
jgi:hypothetical protein